MIAFICIISVIFKKGGTSVYHVSRPCIKGRRNHILPAEFCIEAASLDCPEVNEKEFSRWKLFNLQIPNKSERQISTSPVAFHSPRDLPRRFHSKRSLHLAEPKGCCPLWPPYHSNHVGRTALLLSVTSNIKLCCTKLCLLVTLASIKHAYT